MAAIVPAASRLPPFRKLPVTLRSDALLQACRALWGFTLQLMQAYRHTPGPAHRVMLARRIARNVRTLEHEADHFAPHNRDALARLSRRWAALAGWR